MKNQELFDKTVGILVKAYQQDTLIHGLCHACAVGNLIAGNCNMYPNKSTSTFWVDISGREIKPIWTRVLSWGQIKDTEFDTEALSELRTTGYDLDQIAKIEIAFESQNKDLKDKDGFNGLMSVVDALMFIHEATEIEASTAKQLFTKELTV